MTMPTVVVAGTALPPQWSVRLRGVTVDAALNLPAIATVEIDDPTGAALAAVGATIGGTLAVTYLGTPLFTGDITALECHVDGTGQVAVVVAYDAAHKLQRNRATTAYPNQTYAEVIAAVARAAGVPAGTIDAPGAARAYSARMAEDAWSFVLRLAAEVDRDVVVSAGKLSVLARPAATSAPDAASIEAADAAAFHVGGARLVRLRATLAGNDQIASTTVRGWDPTTKREVVATASAPSTSPGAQPGGGSPSRTAAALGDATVTIPAPGVATSDEATALANSAASRAGGRIAEVDAEVLGTPSLAPGGTFSVGGAGAALDGRYTATSVRHVFDWDTGYRTHVHVGETRVPATPSHEPGGGVVPGVVVDNNDTEGELGRVKVRFDWLDPTYVSDWLRVLQPGASNATGMQVVPEVGDEVLVAFSDAGMRAPYVLGALYNGVDVPKVGWAQVVREGKVVQRVFTSRTGHRLAFVDEAGEQGTVTIATGDASASIELTQGTAGITVTSTHDVAVKSDGNVTVTAAGDATVEAKKSVTVKAASALTLQGATVKVQADTTLELKAANVVIDGSAAVKVSGGVIQLN